MFKKSNLLEKILNWTSTSYNQYIKVRLLGLLKYKKLQISLIDNYIEKKVQLLPSSSSKEKLPAFNDKVTVVNTRQYKPLYANTLTNIITNSYASGFIQGDRLLLPEKLYENRYKIHTDGCKLFKYSTNYCVGSTKIDRSLENAIQIGGSGSFNWYHFLIECLPKVLLASKLPQSMSEWPLLVPQEYIINPNYSAALSLFVDNRPLIPLDQSQNIFVKNLIFLDEVSECPYNYFNGFWPEAKHFMQHDTLLKEYVHRIKSKILYEPKSNTHYKRIFLKRTNLSRMYNQDKLIEHSKRYGFTAIEMDKLPFFDQVKIFSHAEKIIGPSGAAWSGMIFCDSTTKFLSWLPEQYNEFCAYSNLAALFQNQMEFIKYKHADTVESTTSIHTQNYTLDLEVFDTHLQHL